MLVNLSAKVSGSCPSELRASVRGFFFTLGPDVGSDDPGQQGSRPVAPSRVQTDELMDSLVSHSGGSST